jgi:hypothetical protein
MKVPLQGHQQPTYGYQPQHSYRQQTYQHLTPTPQQYYHQPQPIRRPVIAPAYYATPYGRSFPSKNAHAPTAAIANGSFTQVPRRFTRQGNFYIIL